VTLKQHLDFGRGRRCLKTAPRIIERRQFAFVHRFLQISPLARTNTHMKYLHTMVRVTDIEQSLRFYRDALGLRELSRRDYPQGRFTLVFLAAPGDDDAQVELTHNWDPETYSAGRNFGHLAYEVDDIYAACRRLMDHGVTINRPPRDGRMAFVRSPDNVSIELLQRGAALPAAEPWSTLPNVGVW
jgi:lactoylglutathione lyase